MTEAIGAKLGVAPGTAAIATSRKPTEDLEAHTLYRQGRHYLVRQTPENFAAARRCFEQAVERDPRFALAYTALAELWWYFDFMGFAPPKTVAGIGMAYALRALEIDNTLADAHALLGHFRWLLDYDWPAVRRHVDRARELNPSSPMVRLWHAMGPLLAPESRLEEAIDELHAAAEDDPLSALIRAWLAILFHLDRQYDRAAEESRLLVELEPDNYVGYWLLGAATAAKGLFDEAIAAHRRSVELSGGSMLMLGWLGLALGQGGQDRRGPRRARAAAGGGRPPGLRAAHQLRMDVPRSRRRGQHLRLARSCRRGERSDDGANPAVPASSTRCAATRGLRSCCAG